jgi:hypothetical protein
MSGKKRIGSARDFLGYLRGEFSGSERHEFERALEADPFSREALEGMEEISPAQAEEDILSLHSRLSQRVTGSGRKSHIKRMSRRSRIALYSVAATVASLMIIGTLFLQIFDLNPSSREETMAGEQVREESGIMQDAQERQEAPQAVPEQQQAVPEKQQAAPEQKQAAPEQKQAAPEQPQAAPEQPQAVPERQKTGAQGAGFEKESGGANEITEVTGEIDEVEGGIVALEAAPAIAAAGTEAVSGDLTPVADVQVADVQVADVQVAAVQVADVPMAAETYAAEPKGRAAKRADETREPESKSAFQVNGEWESDVELVMKSDPSSLDEVFLVVRPYDATPPARKGYRQAEPEGGFEQYKNYIRDNIRIPDPGTEGRAIVMLGFTVTARGEIGAILPLRSPGQAYTDEAIRLITGGPSWNPASDTAGTIEENIRLLIVFNRD